MKILLLHEGGLGNQLFQYAAGLFYAKKYGATLEIIRGHDESFISFGHPRPFLLSNFRLSAIVREPTLWDRLICSVSRRKRPLVVSARFVSRAAVCEQHPLHDWTFLPALPIPRSTKTIYLKGFYQAYQFAQDVEQSIRMEFSFRNSATGKNLETLNQVLSVENPVSVHVRRGDYAVWRGGARVLPRIYYERAIQTVLQRVSDPTFFVFSDDISFARENLPKAERMVFVDHNDETNPHEDLRLMSACRHNIIANSTLSWWGAWLNPTPTKLVCAPMSWQNDDSDTAYPDIIPPGWLRIPTDIPSI